MLGGRSVKIKTAYISDCGGKSNNDDAVAVLEERGVYVFVGDGLGGYAGGRMASDKAASVFMDAAKEKNLTAEEDLIETAKAANAAVKQLQEEQSGNMKTTCVFWGAEDNVVRWMHIGDS